MSLLLNPNTSSPNQINVLDKGYVELVDFVGSDQRIVAAARVSYGQETKGEEADRRLIRYLLEHKHTSPFEHCIFTFRVKAPLFVVRQWHRHRMWSYNEISARYTELKEEFYIPKGWRVQDKKNKQSSTDEFIHAHTRWYEDICKEAFEHYREIIAKGGSREMARIVLPLSTYTEMYASVDLHNLLHFIKLRADSHAQWEIQQYANALLELTRTVVPVTIEEWTALGLNTL